MAVADKRSRILVFDVNETLLDLDALKPFFARTFGDGDLMRRWFDQQILYSQALTLSERYVDFGTLAVAVLKMLAQTRDVELHGADIDEFAATLKALPAHADVVPALNRLADAGFRMVTLSNSPQASSEHALSHAGIRHYFEQAFSVEPLRRFKPARDVYDETARALGVDGSRLRLVAAHVWDTMGAQAAGWAGAFVMRPGNAVLSSAEQPDLVERTLDALAERIVAVDL